MNEVIAEADAVCAETRKGPETTVRDAFQSPPKGNQFYER
jgi:hypothetical protein